MDSQHEKRRLTTILAADVVGYSRLMAADEAGTYPRLKAHRRELIEPKTAEYHGRVVKLMGDGTLMEFGSVVDAVNFASDAQQAMLERNAEIPEERQIRYRVGINIGDIIVDGEDIGTLSGWCPGHPKVRRAATPTRGSTRTPRLGSAGNVVGGVEDTCQCRWHLDDDGEFPPANRLLRPRSASGPQMRNN